VTGVTRRGVLEHGEMGWAMGRLGCRSGPGSHARVVVERGVEEGAPGEVGEAGSNGRRYSRSAETELIWGLADLGTDGVILETALGRSWL